MSASAPWSRRQFARALCSGALLAPLAAVPSRAFAGPAGAARWIELVNTHTSEVVSVAFADASGFVTSALGRLQHLLRDYRRDEEHPMDPGLYLQLADLAHHAGREPRFEVISGYRSPATNAQLRGAGHGVAEHSLHMEGRAIDVRLKGYSCADLRDLALAAGRGGVGYYRASDFVHIDTGRVRAWQG